MMSVLTPRSAGFPWVLSSPHPLSRNPLLLRVSAVVAVHAIGSMPLDIFFCAFGWTLRCGTVVPFVLMFTFCFIFFVGIPWKLSLLGVVWFGRAFTWLLVTLYNCISSLMCCTDKIMVRFEHLPGQYFLVHISVPGNSRDLPYAVTHGIDGLAQGFVSARPKQSCDNRKFHDSRVMIG